MLGLMGWIHAQYFRQNLGGFLRVCFPFLFDIISVEKNRRQGEEVSKMGSLPCNGCSQLIPVNDKQLTALKIHMIDTHKFSNKVKSIINIAFLNEAEEDQLDQLLKPRIKHFLETGNFRPSDVNLFGRGLEENEEGDLPDIDESISDDEDDELGEELKEVEDMLLEHKLLERLSRSVGNTVVQKKDEENPVELNEKYLEALMAKLREDDEEESDDDDVKGGEEDNDSDTDPFSPIKNTRNSQGEFQNLPEIGKILSTDPDTGALVQLQELQMGTPTSLVTEQMGGSGSSLKTQVKIEATVVVDAIGEKSEVQKRREEQVSLKSENQEDSPPPSDFCRLCYCRLELFSKVFHVFMFLPQQLDGHHHGAACAAGASR